jgi:hypothetical protein
MDNRDYEDLLIQSREQNGEWFQKFIGDWFAPDIRRQQRIALSLMNPVMKAAMIDQNPQAWKKLKAELEV